MFIQWLLVSSWEDVLHCHIKLQGDVPSVLSCQIQQYRFFRIHIYLFSFKFLLFSTFDNCVNASMLCTSDPIVSKKTSEISTYLESLQVQTQNPRSSLKKFGVVFSTTSPSVDHLQRPNSGAPSHCSWTPPPSARLQRSRQSAGVGVAGSPDVWRLLPCPKILFIEFSSLLHVSLAKKCMVFWNCLRTNIWKNNPSSSKFWSEFRLYQMSKLHGVVFCSFRSFQVNCSWTCVVLILNLCFGWF